MAVFIGIGLTSSALGEAGNKGNYFPYRACMHSVYVVDATPRIYYEVLQCRVKYCFSATTWHVVHTQVQEVYW